MSKSAELAHFARAAKLDSSFTDALIGLGRSYMSAVRLQDAVAPLQTAARLQPANPATHF